LSKRRETIRDFSKEKINLEDIIYVLNVAREAPSGANKQPWRFLIVIDEDIKKEIRRYCESVERKFHENAPDWFKKWLAERGISWRKPFLEEAPVLLLVFADIRAPYAIQSTWLAVGYMLLAIEEKGLATVTYTPSRIKWFNEFFNLPDHYKLQTILPIGKPADTKYQKQPRKSLEELIINKEILEKIRL